MPEPFKTTAIGWIATAAMAAGATSPTGPGISEPVAEEILDTAISHCKHGEFIPAITLLRALQAQLDPPPAVRQLIASLIAGGCEAQWTPPSHWELRTALGHDNNINQGISQTTLTVGGALAPQELLLDGSYRPLAARYAEVTVSYRQPITPGGSNLQVTAGTRNHGAPNASPYDLTYIGTTVTDTIPVRNQTVDVLGEITQLWLGGQRYHTALAATAQTTFLPQWPGVKILASVKALRYPTQPQQSANQVHIGLTQPLHTGPRHNFMLGTTGMSDHALGQRAGGHRTGANLYALGTARLQPWHVVVRMDIAHWRSRQYFFPGLIDQERRNRLMHFTLKAEYPLTPRQDIQLELQTRRSNDNIALYTYKSTHMGVSWVARF